MRKPIPGFPGYEASASGDIFGPEGRLSPRKDADGYERVDVRVDGVRYTRFVHTLVEKAFGGHGKEVDHGDGDRTNNNAENLQSVSHNENMKRMAARNGKKPKS